MGLFSKDKEVSTTKIPKGIGRDHLGYYVLGMQSRFRHIENAIKQLEGMKNAK